MLIEGRTVEEIFEAMLEVVRSTHDGYQQIVAVGICLLTLLIISKKDRTRLCLPVLLIAVLLFIPQLYVYLYEVTSYKRFFWLLPDAILVCYVSVLLISKIKKTWMKAIVGGLVSLILLISGQSIYSEKAGFYVKADNLQKVDASTKELIDMIVALDSDPTCIFPSTVSAMTRVYNANIIQGYGRNVFGFNGPIDPVLMKVSNNLEYTEPDTDYVFSTAKSKGIKFVVTYDKSFIDTQICEGYGYYFCNNIANYNIYYNPNPLDKKDEWYITQYGQNSGKCTLYTIEDCEGNLIIIDSGYIWNTDIIKTILRDHNYHVSAWIITTLSDAHSGAFYELLSEYGDLLTIDCIYIQQYSDEMLNTIYSHQMDWEIAELENSASLVNLIDSLDNVIYAQEGEDYNVLGLKMHIYHVWDDAVETIGNREASNSSMVFSVEGNENSMLFLSYVTLPIESDIIDQIGDTKFDYIVVNDHGEWTFGYWWFEMMSPQALFIDEESDRLDFGGCSSPFFTYFHEKGYNTYTFATVPNRIIIR